MNSKCIRKLFDFEGYCVKDSNVSDEIAQITLRRDKRYRLECPDCGEKMGQNRKTMQSARDLPLGIAECVWIVYPAIQGKCSHCDSYGTVHPPGIKPHAKATWRLMVEVTRMCQYMSTTRVAQLMPVSQPTVQRWDKRVLEQMLPDPDLDGLRQILVDEKSIWKHHGYVTGVMNAENGELLHLAKGKKKKAFELFFEKLTEQQRESIEAVCMDRGGAFEAVAEDKIPDADVVYDRFHIIKNYLEDVVDQVRRSEVRRSYGSAKELIKGQRYNLFRNPGNRSEDQEEELEELLEANVRLNCVYVLKDVLRRTWNFSYRRSARMFLERWIRLAKVRKDQIPQLNDFAESIKRSKDRILNYFKHRITLGPLEGFNNLISRLVHRSCGHTDLRYLFLKLRQSTIDFSLQT